MSLVLPSPRESKVRGARRVSALLCGSKAVLAVGDYPYYRQLCLVVFGKDGSMYISTPYFGAGAGTVTSAAVGDGPPHQISFAPGGRVTSHLVKFSHHPDGEVHFSQDSKVRTEIKRRSFNLVASIGEVLQLHIYHPAGFEAIDLVRQKTDRVYLLNVFKGDLPSAIVVRGEWRRKRDIAANTEPRGGIVPPITTVIHRRTGVDSVVTLLGQPEGWPLRDHVLMLSCYPTTPLDNITDKTMILLGGWDPADVAPPGQHAKQTGCLAWLYPQKNAEAAAARLGTIDLAPPSVRPVA